MKPPEIVQTTQDKGIARPDFEAVIRRAFELSLIEADAEDRLSEDEIVRIGTELGLPARLTRQALYELPQLESASSIFERYFGPGVVAASRGVPGNANVTLRRLEDYLTTSEYQQVVRRRDGRVLFTPAEDTISYLARGLLRPSHRFQLARARRVAITARPLDDRTTHVQIATDMDEQRKDAVRNGIALGSIGGIAVGGVGAATIAWLGAPEAAALAGSVAALAGGVAAGLAGGLRLMGRRFRSRMDEARVELEGLLDRAERGEPLEPPPAPWRKRLQMRMLGHLGGQGTGRL